MNPQRKLAPLGLLILTTVLMELLIFNNQYIFQKFSSLEQRYLPIDSGILHQLILENGKLISQGNDPSITFENINTQIQSIFIQCKNTTWGAAGEIYYQSADQPFREPNSITYEYARVSGYENILSFPETQFVSNLRIDPTNLNGDIITCQEFVINPTPQFHLALTRVTLYLCLFALAMFELPKDVKYGKADSQPRWLSHLKRIVEKFARTLGNTRVVILPIAWILFWILPWTTWLDTFPWIRLGTSLFLFVIPGMIISMLLAGARFSLPVHFSCGLAFSVFWVGALGFTGRVFHWPFEYVKNLFALSGLIAILALIKHSSYNQPLYKPTNFSGRTLILLLFMIAFGIIANFQSRHSGDDLSYLAYLTNWQHAQQLDFQEVIFGTGTADSIRFWWGMFPMSLALLAEISHLHGLLLVGFYLEPFLVTTAILAIYNLYEDLLPSQNQAIIALLLHFTFLFLLRQMFQPGYMFFERLSDDKVFAAFTLAPVFFIVVRHFINSFNLGSGLFFLLAGLSLALTHPIILAYSVFIASVYSAIETILKKEYAKLGVVAILLVVIIAPSASLRFIDETWVSQSILGLEPGLAMSDTFSLDSAQESPNIAGLISYIEGTPFYGFNLERIRIVPNGIPKNPQLIFLSWLYVWILGIGFLWSLFNLKKSAVAPFIAAASFLVLLCAIPYTGWLVGFFVSARMLWRAPWLLPIGLISFTLLRELFIAIENKLLINIQSGVKIKDTVYTCTSVACLILVTCFSEFAYRHQWLSTKAQLNDYRDSLGRLSGLGHHLENNIEQPSRFIAPLELMNYLPGLSSKSKVVLLRNTAWAPYPVDINEIAEFFSNDLSISVEQRIQILEKYNVQYILVENTTLKDYYVRSPDLFSAQYTNGYWLIKFREYHD